MVIGEMMPKIMLYFNSEIDDLYTNRRFWISVFFFPIVAPLSSLKSMKYLAFASYGATISITYIIIFVAYQCLTSPVGPISWLPPDNKSWLVAMPVIALAYVCHQNVLCIYDELKDKSKDVQVFAGGSALAGLVYVSVGLFGYITFGRDVEANVFMNYQEDTFVTIGRLAVVFLVTFSYPLLCFPCRQSLDSLFITMNVYNKRSETTRYVFICVLVFTVTYGIALFVTDLGGM